MCLKTFQAREYRGEREESFVERLGQREEVRRLRTRIRSASLGPMPDPDIAACVSESHNVLPQLINHSLRAARSAEWLSGRSTARNGWSTAGSNRWQSTTTCSRSDADSRVAPCALPPCITPRSSAYLGRLPPAPSCPYPSIQIT